MATALVSAAFSVVGKALAPFADSLLKDWAASVELGDNVEALELELLSTQAVLEHTVGKEIADNSAFRELLVRLQGLGYDADDVLDELDYFRIHDQLHGTSAAADRLAEGFVRNKALHAKAVGKQIICFPACFSPGANKASHHHREVTGGKAKRTFGCNVTSPAVIGKCFPFSSSQPPARDDDNRSIDTSLQIINHTNDEPPKLIFNRIEASKRMQHIVKDLQRVQQKVYGIIAALGPSWSTAPNIAQSRLITTSEPTEPELYGRDLLMSSIIHDITEGKHSGDLLTVIPIVGPGGMGKTTLAQHIYHNEKVQKHFEVKVWKCVSLKFNANNLIEEIKKHIPQVNGENSATTAGELIGQRLKDKRFLLVLDDIWDCSETGWQQLLVPFKKSQAQGNIIIVTTRLPAQAQIMIQNNIDCPMTTLQGLEHNELMKLFLAIVFGNNYQRGDIHTFFIETGDAIARKLKGSPLAAKIVGRLLKTQLDRGHWTRVLESKEWERSNGENDIMPALKLSYDYLPSELQRCFSYCGLFPQDYLFTQEGLINFWIGLDVLHLSPGENKRVEDIGLSNLTELVNHGFFEKAREKTNGSTHYILHDLLHNLARTVSSHECLSIDSSESQVSSLKVQPSIRHLSINIDNTSVKDRFTLKNCGEDFNTLDKRLKVEKLRTLMLFGELHGCLVKVFGDLFRESKALRVVFLSEPSYAIKDMLHNFYSLVHLRYLWIQWPYFLDQTILHLSRFYHMMVLEVESYHISVGDGDISNLVKLRHFLVTNYSSIAEVGKLKSLQELRRFEVKQESRGFELRQIGDLVELCGSLRIDGLENVQVTEEADEAKLIQKKRLQDLILCWDRQRPTNNDSAIEEHVLERLKPSSNLQTLSIKGNKGDTCPSWLGTSLSVKNLESLCLDDVAWKTFPAIGELCLVNVPGEEIPNIMQEKRFNTMPEKRFENLRRLELMDLPQLNRWAVHAPCQLFPFLEVIEIRYCSNLVELSFSHSACCRQEKLANGNLFPNKLSSLKIDSCHQLSSFPTPLPWTNEATCCIDMKDIGSPCLQKLYFHSEDRLTIEGKDNPDSTFWNVLAFPNLTKLKEFDMRGCPPPRLHHLQMLSSLRKLCMPCSSNAFPFVDGDSHFKYQLPVEELHIKKWSASGKELTQLLTYFPKLSELMLCHCEKITGLGVMGQQLTAPSQEGLVALEEDGLLLLPPQLQLKVLLIMDCPELSLRSNPHDDSNEDGRTGGLQGMSSLRELCIGNCPDLLSSYSSSSFSSCFPFPNSLEVLDLSGVGMVGMETLVPLSNLSSLTRLSIRRCGDLRGEGLLPLLTQGRLTELFVSGTPNFFVASPHPREHEQEFPPCSSEPHLLSTDDLAGITDAPICRLLVSTLTKLWIWRDNVVERFTEDQEILLLVNSLEEIIFQYCDNLRYLPARLDRLPNLKRLEIKGCKAIKMLPKDSLPSSLQELVISNCPEILALPEDSLPSSLQELRISECPNFCTLPKDGLPSSLQKLLIHRCPSIQSLPKVDDLPSSLRELDIQFCGNEEIKRQCRRLRGIIPIVTTSD